MIAQHLSGQNDTHSTMSRYPNTHLQLRGIPSNVFGNLPVSHPQNIHTQSPIVPSISSPTSALLARQMLETRGTKLHVPSLPISLAQHHSLPSNTPPAVSVDNVISKRKLSQQNRRKREREQKTFDGSNRKTQKTPTQPDSVFSNTIGDHTVSTQELPPNTFVERNPTIDRPTSVSSITSQTRAMLDRQMLQTRARNFHVPSLPATPTQQHSLPSNMQPTVQVDDFISRGLTFQDSQEDRQREFSVSPLPNSLNQHQSLSSNTPPVVSVDNFISKRKLGQQNRRKRESEQNTFDRSNRRRLDLESPYTIQETPNHPNSVLSNTIGDQTVSTQDLSPNMLDERNTTIDRPQCRNARTCVRSRHLHKDVNRFSLGEMNVECEHCHALHWMAEKLVTSTKAKFGKCCYQGKIKLDNLLTPPSEIKELYDGSTNHSRSFRNHIREYNSANAFTSLGGNISDNVAGKGPRTFMIHGELRHRTGSLIPQDGQTAVYSQLYIYDPAQALDARVKRNNTLSEEVLRIIQDCLTRNNPFPAKFKHAQKILSDESIAFRNIPASLRYTSTTDKKRYNLPTAEEVAVIIPGDGTEICSKRDIILHLKADNKFMQISETHPCYLPLHYVLLFPYGELGWEPNFKQWNLNKNEHSDLRMTQLEYFSYRLFQRPTEYSTILRGGKLFQEFLVDAWASTEQNRLNYYKLNQSAFRVEVYGDLKKANVDGLLPSDVGKRVILPSSFSGSTRNMHEIFQDSMAITRYNQHPDIFLTMTANPNWPEITSALLPHQSVYDRPDLVARVFELKRARLLKVISEGKVFGRQVGKVLTIEFQKRGLPHMHILIFLAGPDKIRTSLQVDDLVCAEFPDPDNDPELFDTVKRCMVHGPCGVRNVSAPCMENKKCSKKYPREFVDTTTMDQDGYPIYRRRNDGRVFDVRGSEVDNRDVVPYNPYLSKLFDCHINVEVCAGIRCVKYIHKYIYKGHDRATMVLGGDEIQQYLDSRYIGPHEAAWCLFRYPLHEEVPNVVRLHLHLPGEHQVVFDPKESMESIVSNASAKTSTLTGFFECCAKYEYACEFTYQEFPQHFVWNKKDKIWTIRKQDFAIGRMYFANPNCGERFYLRLLLTVVKGPKSYECLRTFNGELFDTFRLACAARDLLEDDGEWVECLKEASHMKTGHQLRRLFSVILTQCHPLHLHELWKSYSVHICDDLANKIRTLYEIPNPTEKDVEDYGLYLTNELLMESGKQLTDFPPMPQSTRNWGSFVENRLIREHLQLQREAKEMDANINVARLNTAQRRAYDNITDSVFNNKGVTFFLNGGVGTGKTFLYNTVSTKCRSLDKIVINVASSGIASLLLIGGRTAHSTFSIPLDINEDSVCHISTQSIQADLIRKASVVIWDEVPMQNRNCVEAVDRTLQDIRKNGKPFGGITVVLGGDFRQILPVVPKGCREQIVGASLRRSILWKNIHVLTLDVNMRLNDSISGNSDFAEFLLKIGSNPEDSMEIPTTVRKCKDLSNLISTTYPRLHDRGTVTHTYLNERTILSPRNDDVSEINSLALAIFPGNQQTYLAADTMHEKDQVDKSITSRYPNEFLNSLNPSGLPPFRLDLKVGAPIMLLRNIAPKDGLCNGTRLMVVRCLTRVIEAMILNGDKSGHLVFIPRISLTPSSSDIPLKMTRRQFPVRLCYAMTINKSQGQSVKFVGIDLRIPVFSHGQLYVALSRCTSYDRISLLLPENDQTTTNIVYPEILI